MARPTLFISDLHLDETRPAVTALFLDFLREQATQAAALYILGDLFEAWIGDDDARPHPCSVVSSLRALTDTGVPVTVMHGNRDFLLGTHFATASGATLLPDPSVIRLHGEPVLLMHGDTLCTDDHDYQQFRRMVRDPAWQQAFLARALVERAALAREARDASRHATAGKPYAVMDVNPQAVAAALHSHGVRRMIHGHTHRPAIHRLELDGAAAERIVLGDWHEQGSVLVCDEAGCRLEDYAAR